MDSNTKYTLLRMCLVSAFASDKFREVNNVDCNDFPVMMKFIKDMYYTYFKYVEKDKV